MVETLDMDRRAAPILTSPTLKNYIGPSATIRVASDPRSCLRGAQAFSHLHAIGHKIYMSLVTFFWMLTHPINRQLSYEIFWARVRLPFAFHLVV